MSRRRMQGMTLTEVLVYCTLLGLFATMLFANLPQRGNQTTEDLRVATGQATQALRRVTLELSNASSSSVAAVSSPSGVIFLSAQANTATNFSYTSSGELAWQGWVGYFLQSGSLVRVWYPFSSGMARASVGTAPTAATMLAAGTSATICRGVNSFTITSPEANLWQAEIGLTVRGNMVTVSSGAGARN